MSFESYVTKTNVILNGAVRHANTVLRIDKDNEKIEIDGITYPLKINVDRYLDLNVIVKGTELRTYTNAPTIVKRGANSKETPPPLVITSVGSVEKAVDTPISSDTIDTIEKARGFKNNNKVDKSNINTLSTQDDTQLNNLDTNGVPTDAPNVSVTTNVANAPNNIDTTKSIEGDIVEALKTAKK